MNLIPSDEQKAILTAVQRGQNIVIDSVAGAGKTSSLLFVAKDNPKLNFVVLTYNSSLKHETRQRLKNESIENVHVHTYHSFALHFYGRGFTDKDLIYITTANLPALKQINADYLIIDEAQDMTPVYFQLVQKIRRELLPNSRMIIMGDTFQAIYDFNNADPRYIQFAPNIFESPFPWTQCQLRISYRITHQIANFVNAIIKSPRIEAVRDGPNVQYLKQNPYNLTHIVDELLGIYKPEEIFILAKSVRSTKTTPIRKMENYIKIKYPNVQIHLTSSDEHMDKTLSRGKLIISTIHQTKGLERKVVILFGFDMSFYSGACHDKSCPNLLYVAITRAKERLIVVHDEKQEPLQWLDSQLMNPWVQLQNESKPMQVFRVGINIYPHQFGKHLPLKVLMRAYSFLGMVEIKPPGKTLPITPAVSYFANGHYREFVADLTGNILPWIYEIDYLKGQSPLGIVQMFSAEKLEHLLRRIKISPEVLPLMDEVAKITIEAVEIREKLDNIYKNLERSELAPDIEESHKKLRHQAQTICEVGFIYMEQLLKHEGFCPAQTISPRIVYAWFKMGMYDLLTEYLTTYAIGYHTFTTGYVFKKFQIGYKNWIKQDAMSMAIERMKSLKLQNPQFETVLQESFPSGFKIAGVVDCMTQNSVIELKTTTSLTEEHAIQLATYALANIHHQKKLRRELWSQINLRNPNALQYYDAKNRLITATIIHLGYRVGAYVVGKPGAVVFKLDKLYEAQVLETFENHYRVQFFYGKIPIITVVKADKICGYKLGDQIQNLNVNHYAKYNMVGTPEHSQFCKYKKLFTENKPKLEEKDYYLYNINTGQLLKMTANYEMLNMAVAIILGEKNNPNKTISNMAFLEQLNF